MPDQDTNLSLIAPARRAHVQNALHDVIGAVSHTQLTPLSGGASGASIYRVEAAAHAFVLRLDAVPGRLGNPQRGYTCMRMAAEAGIAPRLHFADPVTGVSIMDFIEPHPVAAHPGSRPAVMRELGELIARLQAISIFPSLASIEVVIAYQLSELRQRGLFRAGVLDAHQEAFERLRAIYPWQPACCVSSHNDPNSTNVLFDGRRLWLIDWEAAYCNEPLADVASVSLNFDATPELETVLLAGWLGHAPDRVLHAKLVVMRQLCRLYYACLALSGQPASSHDETLADALTPPQLMASMEAGAWVPGAPSAMLALGKCFLATFLQKRGSPELESALAVLA